LHWIHGQHKKAIELGQKALDFAQKAKHFSYQVATMSHLGIFFFNIGDYPKQIEIHQKVRKQLIGEDALKQHGLASLPGALSRSMLVLGLAELGKFDSIEEIGHEAIEIAEQVRNALTLTFVYNFVAMAYLRQGRLEPALTLLEKGHELCRFSEVQSMYSYTVGSLGCAYLLAGEPERALSVLEEGATDDNLQVSFWPTHPLTVLADAYRALGDISLATETVERALKLSDEREERGFEAWAMLVMAGIKNAAGQPAEAVQLYRRALQQASDLSMRPLAAHCHKGLASSYLRLGNEKEAQSENETARKMYRSLGMTYWLQS
jgi:tetratricopeptide (TPR) repeat protein